ncbi:MAG TPA: hypothetical protein VM695_15420 [Phycisphaerae bacterium]|nr:hypothetical protein [Phycisphaerae bacterium]
MDTYGPLRAQCFEMLTKAILSRRMTGDGMRAIIDHCARATGHECWGTLGRLDFRADVARIKGGLSEIGMNAPPPLRARSMVMQLFCPGHCEAQGVAQYTCDIQLVYFGNEHPYSDIDEGIDVVWVNGGEDRTPAHSAVTAATYRALQRWTGDVPSFAEYIVCLCFVAMAAAECMGDLAGQLPWVRVGSCNVEAAWQNGDCVSVGRIASGTFLADVRCPGCLA